MASAKPIALPRYAKRAARWLGLCAWLAAQSCVGPDLEPPGQNSASAPTTPPAAPTGAAGTSAVGDDSDQPSRMTGSGGSSAAENGPKTSKDAGPDNDEDAGVQP